MAPVRLDGDDLLVGVEPDGPLIESREEKRKVHHVRHRGLSRRVSAVGDFVSELSGCRESSPSGR